MEAEVKRQALREGKSKKAKGKREGGAANEEGLTLRAQRVHTLAFLLLPFYFT
jgi:hypothetical protein